MRIKELEVALFLDEFGEQIKDFDSGYVGDVISEIAERNIDIFIDDLFEWAKYNYGTIQEANEELGTHNDIIQQIQQAQSYVYERDLYESLEDILRYYTYDYIQNCLGIDEITEEQYEEINAKVDFTDNGQRLEDIEETINQIFEESEEI